MNINELTTFSGSDMNLKHTNSEPPKTLTIKLLIKNKRNT